jgi:hypothetical protein
VYRLLWNLSRLIRRRDVTIRIVRDLHEKFIKSLPSLLMVLSS